MDKTLVVTIIIFATVLTSLFIYVALVTKLPNIALLSISDHFASNGQLKIVYDTANNNNTEINLDISIQGITTQEEYTWCQNILKNSNNTQWLSRPQNFASQYQQDWFIYSSMLINMKHRGFYVDLAANMHKKNSNTYFFDKCLSWNGLCIEAEPALIENLHKLRSCDVIHKCIWNEPKNMTFISKSGKTGMAGLKGYNKIGDRGQEIPMQCITLSHLFHTKNIKHIDYLSLDIEGAELAALLGVDFNKTQIDVITVENNVERVSEFIESKGFINIKSLGPNNHETVFVHQHATDKLKWIEQWTHRSN